MNLQEVKELLQLIATGNQTRDQEIAFDEWLHVADKEDFLEILVVWENILENQSDHGSANPVLISKIAASLNNEETRSMPLYGKNAVRKHYFKIGFGIAASLLLMLFVGSLFYSNRKKPDKASSFQAASNEIKPGGNRAVLILSDGSKVDLNQVGNGKVASQSGISIVKSKDGHLIYTVANNDEDAGGLYNTIQTPVGGQYRVNLPDGTSVWLNAASSLHYPVSFDGDERRVELTGEAYFEVAKDKDKPFLVATSRQVVEVLGTHFNVNSYDDEDNTKTTLIEGSVSIRLTTGKNKITLVPGQQSQADFNTIIVKDVDVNEVASWKDGYFVFNNENGPTVMRKIARWYDLEVAYEGNINNISFGGSVARYKNISEIIKTLELTGLVHFKLEGRKITAIAN